MNKQMIIGYTQKLVASLELQEQMENLKCSEILAELSRRFRLINKIEAAAKCDAMTTLAVKYRA